MCVYIHAFIPFKTGCGGGEKKEWNVKCIVNLICANILTHLRGICWPLHKNKRHPPLKWCVVCQKSLPSAAPCQEQQLWTGNEFLWTKPYRGKVERAAEIEWAIKFSGRYNCIYLYQHTVVIFITSPVIVPNFNRSSALRCISSVSTIYVCYNGIGKDVSWAGLAIHNCPSCCYCLFTLSTPSPYHILHPQCVFLNDNY